MLIANAATTCWRRNTSKPLWLSLNDSLATLGLGSRPVNDQLFGHKGQRHPALGISADSDYFSISQAYGKFEAVFIQIELTYA